MLDTSVLLQHCIIPAQYRGRHTNCLSERAMKKTQSFKQSEVKKSKPRQGGPLGVAELIVNGCTCPCAADAAALVFLASVSSVSWLCARRGLREPTLL